MRHRVLIFLLLPAALLPAFAPSNSYAAGLALARLTVKKDTVELNLASGAGEHVNIRRIVDDGMNVRVDYTFTLVKRGDMLTGDDILTNYQLSYQVRRDLINNGYRVIIRLNSVTREKWFDQAADMQEFLLLPTGLKFSLNGRVNTTNDYYFDISHQVTSLDLYPPLSILFNLLGGWNYTAPRIQTPYFNRSGIIHE